MPVDGTHVYVCLTHTFGREPICGFTMLNGDIADTEPPPGYEAIDGNLGTRGDPKHLCVTTGIPAVSRAEVVYGENPHLEGYVHVHLVRYLGT